MTTYTAISATETQSGKPITESLMTRLANNLLACAENDPSAPAFIGRLEAFEQFYQLGGVGTNSITFSVANNTGGNLNATCLGYFTASDDHTFSVRLDGVGVPNNFTIPPGTSTINVRGVPSGTPIVSVLDGVLIAERA